MVQDVAELATLAGQEYAVSDWFEVTQERIQQFADATGDHQWIHLDVERAKRESPFGTTIAHGFFTLSLLPMLGATAFGFEQPPALTVNYGANRLRFTGPVPAGSRVRARYTLLSLSEVEGGWQAISQVTVDVEGRDKPALVAETISRYYRKA